MKPEVLLMGPMYPPTMESLESAFTVHHVAKAPDRDAFIASVADRITAAATTAFRGMDAATMAKLPKLALVSHFGVGVDSVDVAAASARGIKVTNTPDVLTDDVADLTIALLLATVRRVPQGDRYVREGKWAEKVFPLTETIQGKTLGIVGLGRIGRAIAKRAEAFNLQIAYQGPHRKSDVAWRYYEDPVALARDVDLLVAACPGGEATRGLVSRAVLEALGPKGIFVNISRGSVVDERAMIELLREGKLGGAGLDVYEHEPRIDEAFFALDNVVLQPHVGSATHVTRRAMGQLVVDNLAAFFAGKPLLTPYN
ncbi:MAG TPA: 2-hydroxyacid dehydrogenase [Usitatibacter sp.]|jgi:lactate dehydrogenase-like 2-hydroxyacid dehydrogenase